VVNTVLHLLLILTDTECVEQADYMLQCYPSKKSKIFGACRNCETMSQKKLFIYVF